MSKGLLLDYLPDDSIKAPVPEGKIWLYANTDSGEPQIKGRLASGEVITFGSGSGSGGGGETGSALEPYVIVEQEGELKAQKITIDGETVTPDGNVEELGEVGLFRTGMNEPGYDGKIVITNTIKFYQCVSVDTTSGTWSGQEWMLTDGTYSLSDSVSEGLPIEGYVPEVGKSYSSDTLVRIDKIWKEAAVIPTEGLVFHAPLNTKKDTAETGQAFTLNTVVTYEEIKGIYCGFFKEGERLEVNDLTSFPSGKAQRTMSIWFKFEQNMDDDYWTERTYMTIWYGYDSDLQACGLRVYPNGKVGFNGWGGDGDFDGTNTYDLTKWHHLAMTYDGEKVQIFVDGSPEAEKTVTLNTNPSWENLVIGKRYNGEPFYGYLAGARIYNRALAEDEIAALAKEFEPTE